MATQLGRTKTEICFKMVAQETFLSRLVGYLLSQWRSYKWLCQNGMKMKCWFPLLREEATERHTEEIYSYTAQCDVKEDSSKFLLLPRGQRF